MKKRFLTLLGAVLLSLSLIGTSTFSVIADENTNNSENEPDPDEGESGEDNSDNPDEDDPDDDEPGGDEPDTEDGDNSDDASDEDDPSEEDGEDTDKEETGEEEASDEETSEEESADKEPEDNEMDDEELATASARLERALSAYGNVLDSEYDLDKYLQDRVEKGSFSYVNLNSCGYRTSDEVFLDFYEMPEWAKDEEDWLGPLASWAALCNYYDDYINHDAEYYDFGEYITTHTAEELAFTLFDRSVYEDLLNDSFDAWNVPMVSVVRLLPYLSSFDEVTLARVEVTPEEKKAAAERNRAKEDENAADADEDEKEADTDGDENKNDAGVKSDDKEDKSDASATGATDKSDAEDENESDVDETKSDAEDDGKVLGKRREALDAEQSDADDTEDFGDGPIYEIHIFLDGADSGIIPVLDEDGNLLRFDLRYADLPEELPCSFADDDEIFDRWWLKITECE